MLISLQKFGSSTVNGTSSSFSPAPLIRAHCLMGSSGYNFSIAYIGASSSKREGGRGGFEEDIAEMWKFKIYLLLVRPVDDFGFSVAFCFD